MSVVLRRGFGTVELHHVLSPNTTVVLKCRPPYGSPQPNITWHKIGKPSLLPGHDGRRRIRLNSKKNLVIERVQMGDSGEYHCVARNMAATRVGPVMKLDIRGLSFVDKSYQPRSHGNKEGKGERAWEQV